MPAETGRQDFVTIMTPPSTVCLIFFTQLCNFSYRLIADVRIEKRVAESVTGAAGLLLFE